MEQLSQVMLIQKAIFYALEVYKLGRIVQLNAASFE